MTWPLFCLVSMLAVLGLSAAAHGERFTVREDRVYDGKTGLTWQRCSAGQSWNGDRCAGAARPYTFNDAQQLMGNGWRLPTHDELASLVDDAAQPRRIVDPAVFPNLPTHAIRRYWTAETATGCVDDDGVGCAVAVNFDMGGDLSPAGAREHVGHARAKLQEVCAFDLICAEPRNFSGFVRLVRIDRAAPQQAVSAASTITSADGRFTAHGDDVLDHRTGLIWQRCPGPGQAYKDGIGCTGSDRPYSRDEMLRLAADGRRLPTKDELLALLDKRRMDERRSPYIDVSVFPEIRRDQQKFWTSTVYGGSPSDLQYWCVDFALGVPENCGPYPELVRLVRDR